MEDVHSHKSNKGLKPRNWQALVVVKISSRLRLETQPTRASKRQEMTPCWLQSFKFIVLSDLNHCDETTATSQDIPRHPKLSELTLSPVAATRRKRSCTWHLETIQGLSQYTSWPAPRNPELLSLTMRGNWRRLLFLCSLRLFSGAALKAPSRACTSISILFHCDVKLLQNHGCIYVVGACFKCTVSLHEWCVMTTAGNAQASNLDRNVGCAIKWKAGARENMPTLAPRMLQTHHGSLLCSVLIWVAYPDGPLWLSSADAHKHNVTSTLRIFPEKKKQNSMTLPGFPLAFHWFHNIFQTIMFILSKPLSAYFYHSREAVWNAEAPSIRCSQLLQRHPCPVQTQKVTGPRLAKWHDFQAFSSRTGISKEFENTENGKVIKSVKSFRYVYIYIILYIQF